MSRKKTEKIYKESNTLSSRRTGKAAPPPSRVVIDHLEPCVDGGRFPAKCIIGETVTISAVILVDGHDLVKGHLLYRKAGKRSWERKNLKLLWNDIWQAEVVPDELTDYEFTVEASLDRLRSWYQDCKKKLQADQATKVDIQVGEEILSSWLGHQKGKKKTFLQAKIKELQELETTLDSKKFATWFDEELRQISDGYLEPATLVKNPSSLKLRVDPKLAGFSSWYEFFPRSCSPNPRKHGTFKEAKRMLSYVADLGFDIVYLPPIHPIGDTFRKGKNNSLEAKSDDVGSPWAIGSEKGGHKSIHPQLGTFEDFQSFLAEAQKLGLKVALDIAFQCSPDHPYVKEHPEWFKKRPDGSIQYAENPPKKYQDIYPFDFESADWKGLWEELLSVFQFWIDKGVLVFRVDNPHTKSLPFWEFVMSSIRKSHPEVIFLSEAFTRPHLKGHLAKVGFHQSYTYFTWRHTRQEFTEYLTELNSAPLVNYLRPNFWPNTPDILTDFLKGGERPHFAQRLILAATLAPNFGVYGPAYELMENQQRAGAEEYLNNEKYEIRHWDLKASHSLAPLMKRLNQIRKGNPALQGNNNFQFHETNNDQLLAFSKQTTINGAPNIVLTVVNLDPHHTHAGLVNLPLDEWEINPEQGYVAEDVLGNTSYKWHGWSNYVELNPHQIPAHIFVIKQDDK